MDHDAHVTAIVGELGAIQDVLDGGPIGAPVATCPGWTLVDLTSHVGQFCGFWAHVLCEGTGRAKPPIPDPPDGEAAAGWFRAVGAALVTELRATPPETTVWTWYEPDRTAAFVARRAANELAVHRYDAQSARGTCAPIVADLAVDGIDEMVDRLILARPRSGVATGETLHLHGTDGGEWSLALLADRVEVRREHGKADLALRGAASDLELLLYRRPPLGPIERFGDETVLDAWDREFVF
jgi:uncharacterized protein (TIGR03083 family)